jgi:hypothetical protein
MQKNSYVDFKTCFCDLLKNDKRIFFRGIGYPLLFFPIDRAISFKIYDDLNKKKYNPYLSGLFASIISSFTNVPLQYISSNVIHMDKDKYKGVFSFIKNELVSKNNIYKGYFVETSRGMIGSTIFLGTYGNLKNTFPDKKKYILISSLLAVSTTWILTFPIDTIRTDFQTSNEKLYNLIKNRYKNYGFLNFYKGLQPVLLRSFPSSILGMYVYETVKNYLESK